MSAQMSQELPNETSKETSAEEIRHQMRRRFDAVNEAAEKSRRTSRDAGAVRDAEEHQRWSRRHADPDDTDGVAEMAESDAPGG